jgi:prepilin peptidase CpaA
VGQTLSLPVVVVLLAASVAAVTDVWKFKIHNALTLPLLLGGLAFHGFMGGWSGLLGSFLGAAFGFCVLIVFFALGGMGGGDVKLMAAVGAWLGLPLTVFVFLAGAVAGGVYSLIVILVCGKWRETWMNLKILWHRVHAFSRHLGAEDHVEAAVNSPDRRRRVVPFAAMIVVGLVALLVWAAVEGRDDQQRADLRDTAPGLRAPEESRR